MLPHSPGVSVPGSSSSERLLCHTSAFDPGLLPQFARISLIVTKLISSEPLNVPLYSHLHLAKEINRNEC